MKSSKERITKQEARLGVMLVAARNAKKAGRKHATILDAVPVVMTPEYLAMVRKAFNIKGR